MSLEMEIKKTMLALLSGEEAMEIIKDVLQDLMYSEQKVKRKLITQKDLIAMYGKSHGWLRRMEAQGLPRLPSIGDARTVMYDIEAVEKFLREGGKTECIIN